MRQAIWVLIAIVAVGIGFIGGRLSAQERAAIERLQAQIQELEQRVLALASAPPPVVEVPQPAPPESSSAPTPLKIAVVQVNELAMRFQQDNPALQERVRQKTAEIEQELRRIQQQMQSGAISREEAQVRALQLQQELQQQLLLAVAGPIQAAVNEVARELGYDLVMKHEDVVLYYKNAVLDDITEQVWARMERLR